MRLINQILFIFIFLLKFRCGLYPHKVMFYFLSHSEQAFVRILNRIGHNFLSRTPPAQQFLPFYQFLFVTKYSLFDAEALNKRRNIFCVMIFLCIKSI